jgi:hypothetical protein
MSESTRGIIYRILTVVFFALVVFGVIDATQSDQYLSLVVGLLGFGSNGLAARNTTVARRGDNG